MKFTRRVALAAFKASIPVLLGYTAMGMAAGILLTGQANIGVSWGFWTSFTSISGALQFLLVDMFVNHAPLMTVALITLSINLRYSLYGLPMLQRWKGIPLPLKMYMIMTLTDETFALCVANNHPEGEDSNTYCLLIGTFNHIYWVNGVVMGCLVGHFVPFNPQGIDFAMTALFIVILLDQLQSKFSRIPCLVGVASGAIGLLLYPSNMLIPSIAIILAALVALRRRITAVATSEA